MVDGCGLLEDLKEGPACDSVPQTQSLGHYKNGVCKMVVEQKRHVIIYHGRWVWTSGRFRRGAGLWIVYQRHKVWVTTRMPWGRWWLVKGMWIVSNDAGCGQLEYVEEVMDVDFLLRPQNLDYNQNG